METSRLNSPVRLAGRAFMGVLFAMGTLAILFISQTFWERIGLRLGLTGMPLRLVAVFTPLIVGSAILLRAESQLKVGIRGEKWVQSDLQPLRNLLSKPLLIACFCLPVLIGFGYSVANNLGRGGALLPFLFMPALTLLRWKTLLVEPASPFLSVAMDWKGVQPLRSEHWGESKYLGNDRS